MNLPAKVWMHIDNPFLTRDLRRTRVATHSGLWISLLCVATAAALELGPVLIWLAAVELDFSFERPRWPSVTTLAVVHALGCLWAGGAAAGRVLHGERRDEALWAIRLLPLSAGRLVWLNLWLPIYGAFLAWCAGIPLYVMAALLDLGSATGAALALAGAGWAAGMGIPLSILATGMFEGDQGTPQSTDAGEPDAGLAQLLGLLLWISAAAVGVALIYLPDRLPFFGLRTPVWPAALLLLPITWAAGGACCADALDAELHTKRQLPRVMIAALAYVAVLGMGAFWGHMPAWAWPVAALVTALMVVVVVVQLRQSKVSRKSPYKREDAWSAAELGWIAARSENPLLLRDLRAALRSRSLRRSWMYLGLVLAVTAVIVYVVIVRFPGARASMIGPLLNLLLQGLGNQASANWEKEKKGGTLSCLSLCPLSAGEILKGRLAASWIREAPGAVLAGLVMIGLVGWVLSRGHWIVAPIALGVAPLLAALSVWNACHGCAPTIEGADSYYFHRAIVFVATASGVIALLLLRDAGPWICFGLGLLLCAMNVWFTVRVFQEYERRFEVSRTIDADSESG